MESRGISNISTCGIIGYGEFGAFSHTLLTVLTPHIQVKVHSSRFDADQTTFFSLEEVCACDAVILAVPISVYAEVVERIAPLLGTKTIVIDVATVKKVTVDALEKYLPNGHPFISTHPMFGPQSYEKRGESVNGFRIVVCKYNLSEDNYQIAKSFLTEFGVMILEMDSDEHDKLLAESLFLTHYVSQIIKMAGFGRTKIDTVSFEFLMDAVESVQSNASLFKDVYQHNEYCKEVVERLFSARNEVKSRLLGIDD